MKEPPICGALKSRILGKGGGKRSKIPPPLTACLIAPYRSKFRVRFKQNPQPVVCNNAKQSRKFMQFLSGNLTCQNTNLRTLTQQYWANVSN